MYLVRVEVNTKEIVLVVLVARPVRDHLDGNASDKTSLPMTSEQLRYKEVVWSFADTTEDVLDGRKLLLE
jgi:hypothetical protein